MGLDQSVKQEITRLIKSQIRNNDLRNIVATPAAAATAPVESVNGKIGVVTVSETVAIKEEGASQGSVDSIDFVGANVTAAVVGSDATITVTASSTGDAWADAVDADIVPDADGTRDLGATATRFAETYTDALDVTDNITVGGTVDGRDIAADGTDLDDLVTLSGVAANSTHLGTFTGATISDNGTVKAGIQELETKVETLTSSTWTLDSSWTHSSDVASVDFTGLGTVQEILVIALDITSGSSVPRYLRVSVDNGVSFYSTSGNYTQLSSLGASSADTDIAESGSSTNARGFAAHIIGASNGQAIKPCFNPQASGHTKIFTASASNINAVQVGVAVGDMTAGSIYVFTR